MLPEPEEKLEVGSRGDNDLTGRVPSLSHIAVLTGVSDTVINAVYVRGGGTVALGVTVIYIYICIDMQGLLPMATLLIPRRPRATAWLAAIKKK